MKTLILLFVAALLSGCASTPKPDQPEDGAEYSMAR